MFADPFVFLFPATLRDRLQPPSSVPPIKLAALSLSILKGWLKTDAARLITID
jgi:hypothetical protein